MAASKTTTALITPYTFVIPLRSYRDRGRLPADSGDAYFNMFLLDHGWDWGNPELIKRYRGHHPMDQHFAGGISIWCTPAELGRWRSMQNTILTALHRLATELIRDLDTTTEPGSAILQRCRGQIQAIAAEHQARWAELNERINEALVARQAPRWPVPREDTPERRAARERNERYGRGYSTGGFSSI